jgi:polyhydroxyalkanoate synthesis regulator phasin
VLDSLKTYIQLASGLTEATAAKAKEAVTGLIGQGLGLSTKTPDVVGSVQEMADDLMATSKSNRDLLLGLIRAEVDKAVGRVGFVREDELAALRKHVQRLDEELKVVQVRCADCSCCEPAAVDVVIEDVAIEDVLIEEEASENAAADSAEVPVKKKKVIVENSADSEKSAT